MHLYRAHHQKHFVYQISGVVSPWIQGRAGRLSVEVSRVAKRLSTGRNCRSAVLFGTQRWDLNARESPNTRERWERSGLTLGENARTVTHLVVLLAGMFASHESAFQSPPDNKIVTAPVISIRSIRARSRVKSIAETKNNTSNGIRFNNPNEVVSKSSLQPKPVQSPASYCCQPPPRFL